MAYLLIDDLRGGVDRRRPIYALKPGTLWTCINAHITNGGDVEKRKAFVDQGDFSPTTFGLADQGDLLYTFGSVAPGAVSLPGSCHYQQLASAYGGPMTELVDWDLFSGKLYVIARFADGFVDHFYDGVQVQAWNEGIVRATMGSLVNMAAILAAAINARALGRYTATSAGPVITVTGDAGVIFSVQTIAINGGAVDDQTLVDANTVVGVVGVTGVAATFGFPVRGGPGAGALTTLTVGGVDILGGAVNWAVSDSNFATLIANQINTTVSAPEYTAVATNDSVVLHAALTGVVANGLSVVATTTGTASVDGQTGAAGPTIIGTMDGGVTAVASVSQVNTLTLGGTFDPGDRFGFSLTSNPASGEIVDYFGNFAQPFGNATTVKTHKRKMYVGTDGGYLHFCAVNDPTRWNVDVDAGAGFIIASNHVGGSESLDSLETYQGRLAPFARKAIQLWTMQNDDALNNPDQFIEHTGTRSPRSTLEYGGNDVFYLDASGINSLKARDASNNAFVSGVAAPINKMVRDWMRSVTQDAIVRAASAVEPEELRFWMAIGDRIFVYSFFPSVGVAAWSWYEPGFTVSDFARAGDSLWARAGDTLYLYGGSSGAEYDACRVEVQFPFLTAGKPGTFKNMLGMDMAATGTWDAVWKINPNDTELAEPGVMLGSNEGVTFTKPDWDGVGDTTHVAPLLTHERAEYASLSQIALYYQGGEESS